MAIRKRWLLPTGVFFTLAVLVLFVLANTLSPLGLALKSHTTAILHVPADYATIQAQVRDIDDDNDTDVWDLRVTNPDGASLLLPRAFTVAP